VTLEDAGKPVAKTKADVRGEWVITPEQRLGPGEHQLALSAIAPGDERPSRSAEPVTVTVPPDATAGSGSSSAPARLAPPPAVTAAIAPVATRPPVVTQPPGGDATVKRALSVDAIGYDEAGRVVLSGRAEPGAELRLYLDDRFVGALKATDGAWSETLPDALAPGVYRLRVDEVRGPEGKVVTRVALPFQRAVDAKAGSVDGDVVVVQPGNSLWRIAKRSYGAGPRYVQIFDANRDQIADPDLIYPGQIFELPKR
jgi:nucleoid-associated protein YgaU